MKRKWKIAAAVVCAAALVTVAFAATSGAGSQGDPLITLSYLNGIFSPKVEEQVETAVNNEKAEHQASLDSAISQWDSKVQDAISKAGVSGGSGAVYQEVILADGKTLTVSEGCEVILRSGAAGWTAENVTMLDSTSGGELASGKNLAANHLYVSLGAGSIAAVGGSQSTETTGTINAGPLNVRSAPNGTKVGTLNKGDTVVIVGSSNGWYQITSGSLSGYVSADFVTVNQSDSSGASNATATLLVKGTFSVK